MPSSASCCPAHPTKVGVHLSAVLAAETWVPAFAGMAFQVCGFRRLSTGLRFSIKAPMPSSASFKAAPRRKSGSICLAFVLLIDGSRLSPGSATRNGARSSVRPHGLALFDKGVDAFFGVVGQHVLGHHFARV